MAHVVHDGRVGDAGFNQQRIQRHEKRAYVVMFI